MNFERTLRTVTVNMAHVAAVASCVVCLVATPAQADVLYDDAHTGAEMLELAQPGGIASIPAGVRAETAGDSVVFPDVGVAMSRRAVWVLPVSEGPDSGLKSGDTLRARVEIDYQRDPSDLGDELHFGIALTDGARLMGVRLDEHLSLGSSVTALDECYFVDGGYNDLELTSQVGFERNRQRLTFELEVRPGGSNLDVETSSGASATLGAPWSLDPTQPLSVVLLRDFGDESIIIESVDIFVESLPGPLVDKFANHRIRTAAVDPTFGCGTLVSVPPQALCADIVVDADPMTCMGCGSIDAGSFDPDGTDIDMPTQTPMCDYPIGETDASLLVVESAGSLWSTCEATVRVIDGDGPDLDPSDDDRLIVCGDEPRWFQFPVPTVSDGCDTDPELWGDIIQVDDVELVPTIPLSADFSGLVRPGSYLVRWWARDAGGNVGFVDQHFEIFGDHSLARCCEGPGQLIVGSWWGDLIHRTNAIDYHVQALGGGDLVVLGGGNDCVLGGGGGDSIDIGTGTNVVYGGTGGDAVYCGFPTSTLTAYGNSGADALHASWCMSSTLHGGEGDDVIYGSQAGPDYIVPGPGHDYVDAGGGDDTVVIYHRCEVGAFEQLHGNSGDDTLIIPVPLAQLQAGGLLVSGFETIIIDDRQSHLSLCSDRSLQKTQLQTGLEPGRLQGFSIQP